MVGGVHGASARPGPVAGTESALRDATTSAIRYWERGRVAYDVVLALVVCSSSPVGLVFAVILTRFASIEIFGGGL